jgi:pimeloyl-ACP methyl ester carboxylesterase
LSTTTTFVIDGLRTNVRIQGEGPPLLLIGGLWSQVSLWDTLLPHLAGFRTIAFDPPGIGRTDLPRAPYTVRRHAAFAGKVLEAAGVGKAHVLGVSLGGAVAQELARRLPNRVDRLVLVSTSYGVPGPTGRLDTMLRFLRPTAYRDLDRLEDEAGRIFGGRLRSRPELVHQWDLRPPAGLRAYAFRLAGTLGWSSLPWLHRIPHRTLVVHGDDDAIVPTVNARVLACLVPRSALRIQHGGGHLVLLDSAEEVLPVVHDFLTAAR